MGRKKTERGEATAATATSSSTSPTPAVGITPDGAACSEALRRRREKFASSSASANTSTSTSTPALEREYVRPASTPLNVRSSGDIWNSLCHVVSRRRAMRRAKRRHYTWEQFMGIRQDLTCLGTSAGPSLTAAVYCIHTRFCILDGDYASLRVCFAQDLPWARLGLEFRQEVAQHTALAMIYHSFAGDAAAAESAHLRLLQLAPCLGPTAVSAAMRLCRGAQSGNLASLSAACASAAQLSVARGSGRARRGKTPNPRHPSPRRQRGAAALMARLAALCAKSTPLLRGCYRNMLVAYRPTLPMGYLASLLHPVLYPRGELREGVATEGRCRRVWGYASAELKAVAHPAVAEGEEAVPPVALETRKSIAALDDAVQRLNTRRDFTEGSGKELAL